MTEPRIDADSTRATPPNRVSGRVVRGTRAGQTPIASQWVIIHRVGPDRAGPLDSTRTDAAGRYTLRYRPSGDSTAIYFVSTSYGGVAYFTSPLRGPVVTGDDASLTVFDTTSAPVPIGLGGRHLVIGAPHPDGHRPVVEIFDLKNDTTVTRIARDSASPVWTTHVPSAALDVQVNPSGTVSPSAMSRHGSQIGLFVPISPGIRQFAINYELPRSAFPLSIPFEQSADVVEVMVEEPTAHVTGLALREVAPVSTEGHNFRRFLGQNAPANTLLRVDVPTIIGAERTRVYEGVGAVVVAAMLIALAFAARRAWPRRRTARAARASGARRDESGVQTSPAEALVHAIAALDAGFEHATAPGGDERAAYDEKRAALKRQLADTLASERGRS